MKNLKALLEKRAEYQQTMDSLVNTADTENRAMTEEEITHRYLQDRPSERHRWA